MKYNYMNTFLAKKSEEYLGSIGCYGAEAESPEEALAYALKMADTHRKIMGFPIDIKTRIEFIREL